jgi:hypothetical protein
MPYQTLIAGSIVIGQSQTNPIQLNNLTLVGITTASYLSGSSISFLVSADGINYYSLYSTTGEYTFYSGSAASANSQAVSLDPSVFFGWPWVKARLGMSGSPVLQATRDAILNFNVKTV